MPETLVLTESNSKVTNDVERVLGRKPKDFTEYVKQTALTGVWDTSMKRSNNSVKVHYNH